MVDVLLPGIVRDPVRHPPADPVGAPSRRRRPRRSGGGRAVRARQRQFLAVLAAGAARRSRTPAGTAPSPSTCAATATPSRCRSTPPAASATGPTTWPPWSRRSASTGCTSWAGAWAPESYCSTCSTRRSGWPPSRWSRPVSPYGFGGTAGADGHGGCTPTAPARAAARPTPSSSPRSPRATPPPTARSARARCCARSTSRPAHSAGPAARGRLRRRHEQHPHRRRPLPGRRGDRRAWPGAAPGGRGRAQHHVADGVRRLRHRRPAR